MSQDKKQDEVDLIYHYLHENAEEAHEAYLKAKSAS